MPAFRLCFLLSLPSLCLADADVDIFFTGRLMGHARYPSRQQFDNRKCGDKDGSKYAIAFKAELGRAGFRTGDLLVGLGDNFGPEYGARVVEKSAKVTGGSRDLFLKEFLVWDNNQWLDISEPANKVAAKTYRDTVEKSGGGKIPFDNVACFFALAGYKALVPGKHDFFYGPERLRQISAWLAEENKVKMLGANLHLSTKWVDPLPVVPESLRKLEKKDGVNVGQYLLTSKITSISLAQVVYPWLRTASSKGLGSNARAELCDVDGDALEHCKPLVVTPGDGTDPANETVKISLGGKLLGLQGTQKALCVFGDVECKWLCKPFQVARPFLHHGRWDEGAPPDPFYVHGDTAVFGIVTSAMPELAGYANMAYENDKERRFVTEVLASDEVEALNQAWDACGADALCGKTKKRVLLARMPEEQAGALAKRSGKNFDVVLSQANPRGATPEQTITRSRKALAERALVFSPGAVYDDSTKERRNLLQVRIHRVVQTSKVAVREEMIDTVHTVTANDKVGYPLIAEEETKRQEDRRKLENPNKDVESWIRTAAERIGGGGEHLGEKSDLTNNGVLAAMRFIMKADAAILQKRDIFRAEDIGKEKITLRDFREVVERTLWKGDFLLKVPVKGSVLTSVMEQSQAFGKQEASLQHVLAERNRSLLALGVYQDSDTKKWYVNGLVVDPERLYAIAMPDFMVLGDSPYTQLKTPDGSYPFRLADVKSIRPLAAVICALAIGVEAKPTSSDCGPLEIPRNLYLDNIAMNPAGPFVRPGWGKTTGLQIQQSVQQRDPFASLEKTSMETNIQNRPVLSIALEKLEGSYNLYLHNQPDRAKQNERFSGLGSQQQVLSPERNDIAVNLRVRGKRSFGRGDLFLLNEEYYTRSKVRGEDNGYIADFKQNIWALEGGWNQRLQHRNLRSNEILSILSLRYEGQFERPPFTLKIEKPVVQAVSQSLPRTSSLLAKIGLRWQGGSSWFEAGFFAGRRRGIPVRFAIAPAKFLTNGNIPRNAPASDILTGNPEVTGVFACSGVNIGNGGDSLSKCAAVGVATYTPYHLTEPILDAEGKPVLDSSGVPTAKFAGYAPAAFRVDTASRPRVGNFLNFKIQIPIPGLKTLAYIMENRGELNYGWTGDLQLDTKILDVWSNSLKFDITKNLSLVPKIEYLYFQNKINRSSLTGFTSTVGLQYRFEWRPNLPPAKALQYPYPPLAVK